jgi:PspAB-like protein
MGFFDTLFGRQKPAPAGPDKIFAMSTAQVTLQTEQNLTTTGSAAMCFKGMASGPFTAIQTELEQLLALAGREDHLAIKPAEDNLGYRWFIFTGSDFQTLITAVHMASSTLMDRGYDSQLLFALFPFTYTNGKVMYWVYNYKRSMFYPFVPQRSATDASRARDNAEELRLSAAMSKEMPIEPELERWFAVWNPPL